MQLELMRHIMVAVVNTFYNALCQKLIFTNKII